MPIENTIRNLKNRNFVNPPQNYKIITIMKDVPTGDYFALCKLLMTPESDKID